MVFILLIFMTRIDNQSEWGAAMRTATAIETVVRESCGETASHETFEARIDAIVAESGTPTEFIVPGGNALAAALDMARAVARRAERRAVVALTGVSGSFVVPYLNRLADLLYMEARAAEGEWQPVREER